MKGHHKQAEVSTNRPDYREGRWEKAVKVYTVNQESKYVLVQNVHALGVTNDLLQLCALYGDIDEYRLLDEYPSEPFTDVYWVKFVDISSARIAKKRLDNRSFFGKSLHVCYAPEYETVSDTREKLQQRRTAIARKTREAYKRVQNDASKPVSHSSADIRVAAANSLPKQPILAPPHTTTSAAIQGSGFSGFPFNATLPAPNPAIEDPHHHYTAGIHGPATLPLLPPPPLLLPACYPSALPDLDARLYPSAQTGTEARPYPSAQPGTEARPYPSTQPETEASTTTIHASTAHNRGATTVVKDAREVSTLKGTFQSSVSAKAQGLERRTNYKTTGDESLFSRTGLSKADRVTAYLSTSDTEPSAAVKEKSSGSQAIKNKTGFRQPSVERSKAVSVMGSKAVPSSTSTHSSLPAVTTPQTVHNRPSLPHPPPLTGSSSVDRSVQAVRERMTKVWATGEATEQQQQQPKVKKRRRI